MKRLLTILALAMAAPALAAPPVNDNHASFQSAGAALPASVSGTTVEATMEVGELAPPNMQATVWYRWTASATGLVEITTAGSGFDTVLAVWNATPGLPAAGDLLASNDDESAGLLTSRVLVPVTAGQTLAIQAGGYDGATGNLVLSLAVGSVPHDDYATRRQLGSTLTASAVVNNSNATTEPGEALANPSVEATLWFTWTAPYTGSCTVDTVSGNVIDTLLVAYTDNGTLPSAAQEIGRNNDAPGSQGSSITFSATAGQTYAFQAGGMGAARGEFTLRTVLSVPAPPNDSIMSALSIGGPLPASVTGLNAGASLEAGEHPALSSTQATLWYVWTAPDNERYQFDTLTGTNFDTTLAVFTGSGGLVPPGPASLVDANDDASPATLGSRVIIRATAGQTYVIQVGGLAAARGELTLTVTVAQPPNDNYADRAPLAAAFPLALTSWNVRATLEPSEPLPVSGMQATVWYRWLATASGRCVVDTIDPLDVTHLDTILAAYEDNGTLPLQGSWLARNDDFDGSLASQITFNAIAGRTYALQIGSYGAVRGDFPLHLDLTVLPPDIALLSATSSELTGGGLAEVVATGLAAVEETFTVRNTGGGSLTGVSVSLAGPDAAQFQIVAAPPATLADFASAALTIRFNPAALETQAEAQLTLSSSDPDESPLVINLIGYALSFSIDSDSDGLNNASEWQMRALGFQPFIAQPDLVAAFQAGANGAGLFTREQLQGLHAGAQFAERDPATGRFALNLSLRKSADLQSFSAFPFTPAGTSVDAQGNLRFEFDAPGNAQFFKLEVE